MNFESLVAFLSERLMQDLPGRAVHEELRPKFVNGKKFSINHATSPKEGAVLILLYPYARHICFPMICRSDDNGAHSGQMAFPGGKQDVNDENLKQTALREAYEEIGIDFTKVDIIGLLSKIHVEVSNFDVLPVLGICPSMPKFIPNTREVKYIITPSLDNLIAPKNRKETTIINRNNTLIAPCFELEKNTVWGASAMILNELSAIIKEYYFCRQ